MFFKSGPLRISKSRSESSKSAARSELRQTEENFNASVGEVSSFNQKTETDGRDEYMERLVKLVPAEILALYITFQGVAEDWKGIWAMVCLLLVIFVRIQATKQVGKPIQPAAVFVAAVSFVLWVLVTGGHFIYLPAPSDPNIVSAAVGVWTFLAPYVYKGD